MASRNYEVGALNGNFSAAMAAAQNAMNRLGQAAQQVNAAMAKSTGALTGYLQRLNQIAADSSKYAQLKQSIGQNTQALQRQINETSGIKKSYDEQKKSLDAMRSAYQRLQTAKKKSQSESEYEKERAQLRNLRDLRRQYENDLKTAQGKPASANRDAEINAIKQQLKSNLQAIQEQAAKMRSAKADFDRFRSTIKGSSAELKAAEANFRQLGTQFNNSKGKVQDLYNTLKRQKSELASLQSSLSSAGFNTGQFVASEMKLRQEIEATTRAIERQNQVASHLTTAQGRLNDASNRFSEAQNAFSTVKSAVETVASPVIDATQNAMTFEKAMSKVKSLTQMRNIRSGNFEAVRQEMADLTAEAERLGRTSEFTALEAAQAMGKYGKSAIPFCLVISIMLYGLIALKS